MLKTQYINHKKAEIRTLNLIIFSFYAPINAFKGRKDHL